VDTGVPVGSIISVAGIQCYLASPESESEVTNKGTLIVIASDVFGFTLPNTRLIADKFAKECGAICVVPDILFGPVLPFNLMDAIDDLGDKSAGFFKKLYAIARLLWWLPGFITRNTDKKCLGRIEAVVSEYKKRGYKKIALQGYCFGGHKAIKIAQKTDVVDVICAAHPGSVSVPKDIELLVKPCAFVFTPDRDMEIKHKEVDIITKVLDGKSFPHEVKSYANVAHGFAVRGMKFDDHIEEKRHDAFLFAANFFKKVLDLA
jgi:dienelactone hydrolase